MSSVRRSLAFSFLDKYLTQAIMIGTTAIMARLLTPAETGLYLVAYALISFIEAARDFGVGTYIIQKADLDRTALRTAFTATMIISVVLAGLLYWSADWFAWFYGDPDVAKILRIAMIGILIIPLGSPVLGLMRRELAFATLAWINVAAAAVNAATTVTLARLGFGADSYVWGFVLSNALAAALALAARRPEPAMFRPCFAKWREVATFGATATLVALVNMAYEMLPRMLMGRLWGLDAVGIFARAVTICQLPDRTIMGALQPVVLPTMAARARSGGDLKEVYLRGHMLMSVVQWPILAVLALLAVPAVRILLGDQWLDAAPLIQLMAVAAMVTAPSFMTYPLLVSAGRIRDALTSSLISLPIAALIVAIAAQFGPEVLAASLFVTAPWQMAVTLWFVGRACGLRSRDLAVASRASALATLAAAAIPGIVVLTSPTGFDLDAGQTVVAACGAAAGWLTGLYASGHPLSSELTRVGTGLLVRSGLRSATS